MQIQGYDREKRGAQKGLVSLTGNLSFNDLARLLRSLFILMMIPGADRGVDEAAKKEEEANKENDPGHATVELMSFSHRGCLAH
jgi:hypothetical protein